MKLNGRASKLAGAVAAGVVLGAAGVALAIGTEEHESPAVDYGESVARRVLESDDPARAYRDLPASDREAMDDVLMPDSGESSPQPSYSR